jgi:hypothetical protein
VHEIAVMMAGFTVAAPNGFGTYVRSLAVRSEDDVTA